jgi:hypothetical protein
MPGWSLKTRMIETVEVTGRQRKRWHKKINPIWWFLNEDEQRVDDGTADWYHPEWPHWRRWFYWNVFRNPLQNFRCHVIGVQDRNYKVTGKVPAMTIQRDDLTPAEYGLQWAVLRLAGWLWLPIFLLRRQAPGPATGLAALRVRHHQDQLAQGGVGS